MPQRMTALIWGIIGVMAVIGLVAVGVNAYTSSRKGPRWKRRLLAAGLGVLAALGFWQGGREVFRPTCYAEPAIWWTSSTQEDLVRLSSSARELSRALNDDALNAEVIRIRLATVRMQLDALDNDAIDRMNQDEREEARQVRENIGRYLADVEKRLAERSMTPDNTPVERP